MVRYIGSKKKGRYIQIPPTKEGVAKYATEVITEGLRRSLKNVYKKMENCDCPYCIEGLNDD